MLSSEYDMATELMNSHQLWLPVQHLSNRQTATILVQVREEFTRTFP